MNRTILAVAGVLSASSLLLVDSAVKGTVLLALAAVAALILRRDSAATRHLVWLLAIVAMLVVPVLSAVLPQWRVLPAWMNSPSPAVVEVGSPAIVRPADVAVELPQTSALVEVERPATTVFQPATTPLVSRAPVVTPAAVQAPAVSSWNWINALPLVWVIGFGVLMLRLSAARWMLWNSERLATVVWPRGVGFQPAVGREKTPDRLEAYPTALDPIVIAMEAICSQLGIGRPVTLLIHPNRTIPVVWGILRSRLMLPAAARQWSNEQLQSVLLHELAHIKRRDTVVQLLAQVACALHWFNPLVWFAAWRLDVERERSCDDLVLASGIRPSAYAGHLLEVVTGLSPARWTQACGLAMARKSSLEGRLTAVLGKDLNRRGVSVALAGVALAIAVGVAVPIAMLRAADEKGNPPQERKDVAPTTNLTGKLAPETVAKLKWGEPVNGLRMALAYPPALGDALLGKQPHFELVVQNVSENEVHFIAGDEAPNPRRMLIREGERIVLGLSDPEVSAADWRLKPGQCGVLRLYTKEEGDKNGTIPSSAIESDLSKIGRYHAIVQMEITKAPEGAWTGKLVTGQTRGSADVAAAPAPMHKDARALYEVWQRYARANGDIPGALVGELAAAVKTFIKYNPTWETVPKLNVILPRLDATHDWKSADSIALLDEVAGVQDSPLKAAAEKATRSTIRKGEVLPKKFADAPWGDAQPNSLRAAWVLEPIAAEHRIGAALKARLLVWNPGAVTVTLQVPTFHQGGVKARDATDAEVQVSGISWTTRALLVPVRLAPGDYIEIRTPGVGIGPRAGMGPWAGPRVGSNVLAKAGDELTLTHGLVPLDGSEVGVSQDAPHVSGPGWWLAHVKARLNRELPLPAGAAERTHLLDRAVRELFATTPTAEETAAFIADKTPDALDALAKRLVARVDVVSFSGKLPTAPAKFRVLVADANADKQPRVVLGPGEYPLPSTTARRGDATLKIVGRPVGDRRTNDALLLFEAVEFTGARPPNPHKLEVPDGWGTWAIVCRPDSGVFYLLSKGAVRKIDYSDPRKVTDTPANDLPAEFRDEVKRILDIHEISAAQQAEIFEKPAAPAATPDSQAGAIEPEKEPFTAWGKEVGGLQAGLGFKSGEQRAFRHGESVKLVLRVRNIGKEEVKFSYFREEFYENPPFVTDAAGNSVPLEGAGLDGEPRRIEANLAPGKEVDLSEINLVLRPASERGNQKPVWKLFGTGKFELQCARVAGNFEDKVNGGPDPILSKLATGKLELVVQEVPAKNGGTPADDEQVMRHEKRIQGTWQVVEAHVGGTHAPRERSKEQVWKFDRDKLVFDFGDGDPMEMTYRIDEKREPATIDLSPLGPREKGQLYKGIYQLDGDELKVHFTRNSAADSRPTKFEPSGIDRGMRYFVLKRAHKSGTPAKKEEQPFTAWGEAVDGLQAGLGFKTEQRAYTHGEMVTVVLRVRNIGKEDVKFSFFREEFYEYPPIVTDAAGKSVTYAGDGVDAAPRRTEVNLAPGKEIDLSRLNLVVRPASQRENQKPDWRLWGTGKFQLQCARVAGNFEDKVNYGPDPILSKLATGKLELEVKEPVVKEPFTAWGKEVGGLQAGLGFKAGEKRAYTHGEWATLVVRVRNVGKEEVKFQYLRQFFVEQPPTVFNEKGELKQLGRTDAFGEHIPVEVKLAARKEIELYELKFYLGTGSEEGKPKYPYIFGTGKFQVQYEKVFGNSSSGSIKHEPTLSKLATGKLELEIKPVTPGKQEASKPKPGAIPVGAQGNWTNWTEEWLALSKVVAESRGLANWKPDDLVAWGAEEGGLRSGLMMKARAKLGEKVMPLLVLKNVSDATKEIPSRYITPVMSGCSAIRVLICAKAEPSNRTQTWCCSSTGPRPTTPMPLRPRPTSSSQRIATAPAAKSHCCGTARR